MRREDPYERLRRIMRPVVLRTIGKDEFTDEQKADLILHDYEDAVKRLVFESYLKAQN